MARNAASNSAPAVPKGRLAQFRAVFTMTRKADPAAVWWMLLAVVGSILVGFGLGLALGHPIYVAILGLLLGILIALVILSRRAERAAFAQVAGQPGAVGYALQGVRRGWNVEQQPVAVDPKTHDLVFRAIGRPGVVLVTEGPLPRVNRLVDTERKRLSRVLPNVPVHIVNAGGGEGQVPLSKLSRKIMRMRPELTKPQVSEVSKRLTALGAAKLPVPKGIDPMRARPDRKATRGR